MLRLGDITVKVAMKICRSLFILGATCLLLSAGRCADWRHDETLRGVAFSKVRVTTHGLIIGRIPADTIVHGRPCRTGWLHLHPNGEPALFDAAADIRLPRLTIPAGTWVRQNPEGVVTICAFPQDTVVQGHLCRGTGGSKGVQTSFHPNGALKRFFPPHRTIIDGIPCGTGLVRGWIELHENGRLKSCTLGESLVRAGRKLRKGTRITLTPEGELRS